MYFYSMVSNYRINVFNIAWLTEAKINLFKSDCKYIAQYLRAKWLKKRYVGSKEKLRHANETLKMFSALTGDDSFEKVYNESNFKEGDIAMCDVVEIEMKVAMKALQKVLQKQKKT